ncbi:helix-turn-helix domain-containing protein [Aurantimonas sp. C2-6-R+9]|uniref:helix-turn-helix domain-containing protein n=1 Tax=unclassified Aurantimonas TaxID=2638230 RepID=UPI002E16D1BC|nr:MULTISPECIES: helix-turn-helix domain-containing protein [unclassified Aurantimonas]MEC5291603.1 helix-turn-helix domain-containing protein [Aurantimonas sp. C2-3-R2]MEC5383639.1 helix-turn-helix domain-containing protein [Aurantimonas sp. C2-6-R+9]
MARRPSWRAIGRHRTYTVDEAATALGVHRRTIRRWLKVEGLEAIDGRRPTLIHGSDLIAFLKARKPAKRTLQPHEGFCFSCREPRRPAFDAVEVEVSASGRLSYLALCETCATTMHKKLGKGLLPALEARCTVTIRQADARIG